MKKSVLLSGTLVQGFAVDSRLSCITLKGSKLFFSVLASLLCLLPAKSQDFQLAGKDDTISYCLGVVLGTGIKNAGVEQLKEASFMQAINDVTTDKQPVISPEQANMILDQHFTELNQKKSMEQLAEGQAFLAENSKKEGVVTLPSGLQYKILQEGEGISPVDTSVVTVHYTGTFINGEVFDSSVERGEPAQFPVNRVIPGWTEALKLMKPGAKWMIYLPSDLAYGERGAQTIPPHSVLVFEVELLAVDK
ncbi:MAG: FKBP-type peptidyl-prolyl cis-trans isomerase [Bacteroidales bacterium]|nr:FKBP-type peptidyl-prolyl cis-trans isomerase [Bacteroidales bacterium]